MTWAYNTCLQCRFCPSQVEKKEIKRGALQWWLCLDWFNVSDHHCCFCHCPNHHYHQHHCILLLLLLPASSQHDCACEEKPSMHTKLGCTINAALWWESKNTTGPLWTCQLFLSRSHSLSLFLANCINVYETKGKRDWGTNKAESLQKHYIHMLPGNLQLLPRHQPRERVQEKDEGIRKKRETGGLISHCGSQKHSTPSKYASFNVRRAGWGLTLVVFL